MDRRQIIFGFLGLLSSSLFVLKDIKKEKSWHDFFKPLPSKESKLLKKPGPLAITKETNKRIKGVSRFQSEEVGCSLFSDMEKSVKQENEVSKVTPVNPPPKSESIPIKTEKKFRLNLKK